ncbi:Mo-dependent nitrogenase C-terminal domain-containing protein [Kamptonema animale CS-326]|jgi:tellurite resistance protein|uniref:Mo-dependent nitrogenase C-terminal domain-containing protein n=1 Tax=Kamptonema animale TaxID=92934 RepID=UPI00232DFC34|nr:Mo-dependent nitrogenase C-terminal domain-containing protein [Kamptonema animale]MDB9514664.1 Mo-dependent nitrogenase C-terminal domain-containing protein [Kamptonema animale CS-326]
MAMINTVKTSYTNEQIAAWLRGLLTIAWADGNFDEGEQDLIASLTQAEFADEASVDAIFEPISPQELVAVLGQDRVTAENFLRTAVMVALADGIYSFCEDELLHELCDAFGVKVDAIAALRHTIEDTNNAAASEEERAFKAARDRSPHRDVLQPVRVWLDGWEIHDPSLAHFVCKMIPPQCPFERDITLFGRKLVHIPPMCKLNPLYDQLVGLRFRALSYLADECKEDISEYC